MKTRIMVVVVVLLFLSPSLVHAFGHCDADLNGDGVVGPADLAMLLASWGPCEELSDCCFPQEFPGCQDNPTCESEVCAADPFCCDTEWDSLCASAAATLCPECFGLNCCFPHNDNPGCTDAVCEEIVCDIDPGCCIFPWAPACANLAALFCDQCHP